ncbi:MAG TPA: DMT family transporter [Geminicoccus sp.]|nr:DMT family transporter [Geminicoccus sp.]HEX2528080.1 DMT family transporter [Geminicoccus sp.]
MNADTRIDGKRKMSQNRSAADQTGMAPGLAARDRACQRRSGADPGCEWPEVQMLSLVVPVLLAVAAGVSIVVQQGLNSNLRTALNSAVWSGFMSYFVGLVCMTLLALALRDPLPSTSIAARIPWWAWSGGLFGAIFIGLAIVLVPQLGAASFIALLVTGQMLGSVAFDHFGWLGLAQRPIDLPRLIGVALLIAGVVLIRR